MGLVPSASGGAGAMALQSATSGGAGYLFSVVGRSCRSAHFVRGGVPYSRNIASLVPVEEWALQQQRPATPNRYEPEA
jgi:hypothetical protein